MYVLGIETSCDETSVAVVKDGKRILSNEVSSSLKFHQKYGGVVPEIASRLQLEAITPVAELALEKARVNLRNIGLISVTSGPGLLGSLLVGISFAKAASLSLEIPLLGVNHVHSHIYAAFLNGGGIKFPFVSLVVSGGHTSLFYIRDFDKIEVLGETLDDACGEAFDKVAKILKLGYPGGPLIEKLARSGDEKRIKFGCSDTQKAFDFSFSGIKTAVLYAARGRSLSNAYKKDIAASFQKAVIDVLIKKSLLACKFKKVNRLVVGGGVIANNRLRDKFLKAAEEAAVETYFPQQNLCTDNAAMVAGFGFQLFQKGVSSNLDLTAQLN